MSSREFAHFVELLFFAMLGCIVLSLWFGIVMSFVYNVLKMVFGKSEATSTEPGQSKDKAKKPKFARQAETSSEVDSEEVEREQATAKVAARTASGTAASAAAVDEEPEERPDYSQRMADEFEAHTVTP